MAFKVLVVSGDEIRAHFPISECINVVEDAYRAYAQGETELSPKHHWIMAGQRTAAFAGYIKPQNAMAFKIAEVRPENLSRGLPRIFFQVLVHDPVTGQPLAFMDGNAVTYLRTGAAAAIGAKYLARKDATVLGIIGTGALGRAALAAMCECFPLTKVYACDLSESARQRFAQEMRQRFSLEVIEASLEETVRQAHILVTATPSTEPHVKEAWVRPGLHISAMGADAAGKQELESTLAAKAVVVCDSIPQCVEIGEINVPLRQGLFDRSHIVGEIGEIILGTKPGRTRDDQITLFDSSGIAVQDAAAAKWIYERAKEWGMGTWVEL